MAQVKHRVGIDGLIEQVFVTLTHRNPAASEDEFLYFNTKWPCYLLSLKDLVEIGKGRPYPNKIKIHIAD